MKILDVRLEVIAQAGDALRQERDLYFRRSGVLARSLVRLHDLRFLRNLHDHALSLPLSRLSCEPAILAKDGADHKVYRCYSASCDAALRDEPHGAQLPRAIGPPEADYLSVGRIDAAKAGAGHGRRQ